MPQVLHPNELQSPALALEFLEYAPHRFLREPTYHFRMVDPQSGATAGRINLRNSHAEIVELYAGHIGYEVHLPFRGKHLAARAVEMLKPLAARLGLSPLWITVDPENAASRRTCELAGGMLIATIDIPESTLMYQAGARRKCRYRLLPGGDFQ